MFPQQNHHPRKSTQKRSIQNLIVHPLLLIAQHSIRFTSQHNLSLYGYNTIFLPVQRYLDLQLGDLESTVTPVNVGAVTGRPGAGPEVQDLEKDWA